MPRWLRVWIVALMALALPLQGLAAVAAWHCGLAHERHGATGAAHAGHADHARGDHAGHHGHAGHAAHDASAAHDAGSAHDAAADAERDLLTQEAGTCAACAACCAGLALGRAGPPPVGGVAGSTAVVAAVPEGHRSFVPAGLDRPPRFALA